MRRILKTQINEKNSREHVVDLSGEWIGTQIGLIDFFENINELKIYQAETSINASLIDIEKNILDCIEYKGSVVGNTLILLNEEFDDISFAVRVMVLQYSIDSNKLEGRATYFHHSQRKLITSKMYFIRKK